MKSPWWYVACLLAIFAALMAAHLGMLWITLLECDQYAKILFDKLRDGEITEIQATNTECNAIEETFADAAGQYIAVILALLTGAGIAVGSTRERKDQ